MSGVVTTVEAPNNIVILSEHIREFPLSLITPLAYRRETFIKERNMHSTCCILSNNVHLKAYTPPRTAATRWLSPDLTPRTEVDWMRCRDTALALTPPFIDKPSMPSSSVSFFARSLFYFITRASKPTVNRRKNVVPTRSLQGDAYWWSLWW